VEIGELARMTIDLTRLRSTHYAGQIRHVMFGSASGDVDGWSGRDVSFAELFLPFPASARYTALTRTVSLCWCHIYKYKYQPCIRHRQWNRLPYTMFPRVKNSLEALIFPEGLRLHHYPKWPVHTCFVISPSSVDLRIIWIKLYNCSAVHAISFSSAFLRE